MADNNNIIPGFDDEWDKSLKITLTQDPEIPDVLSVYLKGRIDNYNTAFFQKQLEKIISHGVVKVLFRCGTLDYISSSGLGIFASYYPRFRNEGGTFVFTDVQLKVLEIFQLLGFNHFFNIASDLTEAKTFFTSITEKNVSTFPKSFNCPICQIVLKAIKPGKYRCAKCKSIIIVDQQGNIAF